MASFTARRLYSTSIIITMLLVKADSNSHLSCGCSVNVIGPFFGNRFVIFCHDHRFSFEDSRQLKYSWLFSNATIKPAVLASSVKNLYFKVFENSMKVKLEVQIEDTLTCVVEAPGDHPPDRCSVVLQVTPPADNKKKRLHVNASYDCDNPSPLQFEPRPRNKEINFPMGKHSSLTCNADKLPGSENNLTLSMSLRPMFDIADEHDLSSPNSAPPTTETMAPQNVSTTNTSTQISERKQLLCRSYTEERTRTSITMVFDSFISGCPQVYVCRVGYPGHPSYESSVLVLFQRRGRNEDSHEVDDPQEKKVSSGIIIGATLLVFLAGIAVAVAIVWKKRMAFRGSRLLTRRVSSSKVPLFINKSYNKSVKSELEEFPRKNIRFLEHIGKGTFGSVVMAEVYNMHKQKSAAFANRWTTVAVKMTLISEKSNEQLKKDFLCELALMKTIPAHTNIITLYASCTAHDPYLIILEYAEHGDLRKYLLKHRCERNYANAAFSMYGVKTGHTGNLYSQSCHLTRAVASTEKRPDSTAPKDKTYVNIPSAEIDLIASRDLLSFALQICRGLDHLSQNKIVHRDVAARNVLVCEHKVVKISDFGLARKVGEEDVYERTTKGLLPIRWMSPESLFYNQFSEKSDVWSYGVLLWELITLGSTPYPGLDSPAVLDKIRKRELLICPPHSSSVVNDVVTKCWTEDPQIRPCFSTLVECLDKLLESEVEYLDLDQINDHEYSTLD